MQQTSSSTARTERARSPGSPPSWNPLADHPDARVLSSYHSPDDLVPHDNTLHMAHARFSAHVLDAGFPCVGAKSAFNRGRYRFGLYPPLASAGAALGVCHDLYEFSHEFDRPGNEAVTFVALFRGPGDTDEAGFERSLWSQLQQMHAIDSRHFDWDPRVSQDPHSAEFSFSIGARAFFIVGLHPKASRVARRAPNTTVVFNLHEQFESLRSGGKYETMQKVIRSRDVALQGSVNPVLETFGKSSEARQYSGRANAEDWHCPFHHLHSS